MRIQKRISLLLAIIVLAVTLSGCIDFRVDLVLNKDNTGSITMLSAVDQDIEEAFASEDATGDSAISIKDNLPEGLEGVNFETTPLSYKKGESTYKGEKVEASFNNTDEFFKEMAKDNEESLRIIDLPNGNKRIEIVGTVQDDAMVDFNVYQMISEMGGEMIFTIKTDFTVVNHNATSVKDGIYTWNLLELVLNNKGTEMTAFLEYTPENVVPLPSPIGKSRDQVEKSLGLESTARDFHGNALNKLGILKGTDKGLELENELTRAQGAIMYARLLGVEKEAEKWAKDNPSYKSPFTDVPDWAKATINFLHNQKLINGISSTEYGSANIMSVNDYTTLVLRALGYKDSQGDFQWNGASTKTVEIGLYKDDIVQPNNILGSKSFTRGSMAYVSYNALFFESLETGKRLIDNVIN